MTAICDPWPSNDEWLRSFQGKAARERIPVSGMIEVTKRCSLRCMHCYLGPDRRPDAGARREMSTAQVVSVLDQAAEAGCLYLALTGGDPMVRPDFGAIYTHAKSLGLVVTVLCSGTLIDDAIVALFTRYPPRTVEITLYGAGPRTHDAITRGPGSFDIALASVRELLGHGVRVSLKTVVMPGNLDEVPAIEAIASGLGVPFRLDPLVFGCLGEGAVDIHKLRVPAQAAVDIELANPRRLAQWEGYFASRSGKPATDALYTCGGGVTGFFVDAQGYFSPCLMAVRHRYNLIERGFKACWEACGAELRALRAPAGYPCRDCAARAACTNCPALAFLENGDEGSICRYACEIARRRHDVLVSSEVGSRGSR